LKNKITLARYLVSQLARSTGKRANRQTILVLCFLFSYSFIFAQQEEVRQGMPQEEAKAGPAQQQIETKAKGQMAAADTLTSVQNVTMDFKEADIQRVLKIISYKSGVNIVTTPDVIGNVTIRLVDVPWGTALDVLLKTYGFGYQRQGNIILVTKLENISKIEAEEALQTEIFTLKFLDAQDAQKILIPLLSPRGKISVLYTRGQKGWKFGTFKIGKEEVKGAGLEKEAEGQMKSETISIEKNATGELVSKKAEFEPSIKSKTLIITDTAASLDKIRNVILPQVDKKPKQVLIEARIMEVSRDKLKDLGLDWGTGSSGAATYTTAPTDIGLNDKNKKTVAGRSLASDFTPNAFSPIEGTTTFPGTYPYRAGLELLFKKLGGTQFEIILHALEEDAHTNTLSAPRILTLDNQEASILVGFHTPILSSTLTAGTTTEGPTQVQTLDYYQEIGIRLNVVPQISEEGYINMIIHPSVTSSNSNVTATNVAGTGTSAITSTVNYPVIDVREAQTQVLMKDGETIVLGGLLKDIKSKQTIGIPFLSKIPLLGNLFKRQTDDVSKIDLLIFITARVLKEGELSPQEIAKLEQQLGKEQAVEKEVTAKKKKK
jgi:type IV pilus assembly protein PilQ